MNAFGWKQGPGPMSPAHTNHPLTHPLTPKQTALHPTLLTPPAPAPLPTPVPALMPMHHTCTHRVGGEEVLCVKSVMWLTQREQELKWFYEGLVPSQE
jgi:hypothetical protein